jgi:hypothetical protein
LLDFTILNGWHRGPFRFLFTQSAEARESAPRLFSSSETVQGQGFGGPGRITSIIMLIARPGAASRQVSLLERESRQNRQIRVLRLGKPRQSQSPDTIYSQLPKHRPPRRVWFSSANHHLSLIVERPVKPPFAINFLWSVSEVKSRTSRIELSTKVYCILF